MARTTVVETYIPRRSTDIAAVTYDPDTQDLTVEFQSGGVYVYSSVPESIYSGFTAASSAGSYFHRHVKDRYASEKQ